MGDDASRALQLSRQREKEQEEAAFRRKKISDEVKVNSIDNRFAAKYDAIEEKIRGETVGLLTLEEMKKKREEAMREHDLELALTIERRAERNKKSETEVRVKKNVDKSKLSFAFDDDGEEDEDEDDDKVNCKEDESSRSSLSRKEASGDESRSDKGENDNDQPVLKKKRFGMNPEVDTSFLPDREREEIEAKERQKIAQEWRETQEKIKNEEVEITYSYWDGTGHRRSVTIKKGYTIQQFLQRALEALRNEFNELRVCGVDQLMFVKEDLIIPHHYTFYEFIVTKARGKSGPLFDFSVRNDIRLVNDASIEKEESHAGKVCLRSWYERNKHIFPASRWEPYNPEKKWDKYTVKDAKGPGVTPTPATALTAPQSDWN